MKAFSVCILDPLSDWGRAKLSSCSDWLSFRECSKEESFAEADAVIVRTRTSLNQQDIDSFKKLKLIARAGNGLDHLDTEFAREKGIQVLHCPDASADSAAELSIALILMAARQLQSQIGALKENLWRSSTPLGIELNGKTAGIIGLGRIGGRVARRLQAFNLRILACDPYLEASSKKEAEKNSIEFVSLNDLLEQVDLLSIHTPLNQETKRLLGKDQIFRMKKGSILVNAARGGLVDEKALHQALLEGHLFSAACDVFDSEPIDPHHPLLQLPNFVGSAHLGARTREAEKRVDEEITRMTIEFLKNYRDQEKETTR